MSCKLLLSKSDGAQKRVGEAHVFGGRYIPTFLLKKPSDFLPSKRLHLLREGDTHIEIALSSMQYHLYQPGSI